MKEGVFGYKPQLLLSGVLPVSQSEQQATEEEG